MRSLLALWVPLVALQACLPVNRPDTPAKSRSTTSFSTQGTATGGIGGGTSSLSARELLCSSHTEGSALREPCLSCVDAIVGLYCTGSTGTTADPTRCPAAIQGSMGGRINQCLAFHQENPSRPACARSCSTGLVLNAECQCVVTPPPNFGGANGQPGSNPSQYNAGAPVSRVAFSSNLSSGTPDSCTNPLLELEFQVVNRSIARVQDNIYTMEGISGSANVGDFVKGPTAPFPVTDPLRMSNARASIPTFASTAMAGGNISLGRVSRFSGTALVRSNPNPVPTPSAIPVSSALWSPMMGHMAFGPLANGTQALYVADAASGRITKIMAIPSPNPSASPIAEGLAGPYGLAAEGSDVFYTVWGTSGSAPAAGAPPTGQVRVNCKNGGDFCATPGDQELVTQLPPVAGIDVKSFPTPTSPTRVAYLTLPTLGHLLALKPADVTPKTVLATWNDPGNDQKTSIITLDLNNNASASFVDGVEVKVSLGPSSTCAPGPKPPANLSSNSKYYVVRRTGTAISLSSSINGTPIVFDPPAADGGCDSYTTAEFNLTTRKLTETRRFTTPGLIQPTDIKVIDNTAYVTDGATGILWMVELDPTSHLPKSPPNNPPNNPWSRLNLLPPEGTPPKDQALASPSGASPTIRLIRPMGLAVVDGRDLLITEGPSPDPARYPGGSTVRLYCTNLSAQTDGLCKGRTRGFYRMAGSYLGLAGGTSNAPVTAPMDMTFAAPGGIAVDKNGTVYLASGGADSGIFKLARQYESPLVGIKYGLSDAYGNKATQCLKFHTTVSCEGTDCVCRAIQPMDRDIPLWSPSLGPESCTYSSNPAFDAYSSALLGYWIFDETSGAMRWADSVSTQHLTPRSTPATSGLVPGQGVRGNAGRFDPTVKRYADTPLNDSSSPVGSLVVSVWVKLAPFDPNDPPHKHTVTTGWSNGTTNSASTFDLSVRRIKPSYEVSFNLGSDSISFQLAYPLRWHHLLAVASNGVLEVYVDGVKSASQAFSLPPDLLLGFLKVGGDSTGTDNLDGWIDELAIWKNLQLADAAARQALATRLYNSGAGTFVLVP